MLACENPRHRDRGKSAARSWRDAGGDSSQRFEELRDGGDVTRINALEHAAARQVQVQ